MISPSSARPSIITPPQPPTGYESPADARDNGWLGQVPPPPTPPAAPLTPKPPDHANPQMAPDPWISPPPLYGDDSTLFG